MNPTAPYPLEHGVLLATGVVCPAASEAIAVEQAERVDGIHCVIVAPTATDEEGD